MNVKGKALGEAGALQSIINYLVIQRAVENILNG